MKKSEMKGLCSIQGENDKYFQNICFGKSRCGRHFFQKNAKEEYIEECGRDEVVECIGQWPACVGIVIKFQVL
jgi:hypothetical protein